MKKTAVICEINPYHNGHMYIFNCARTSGSELTVAVMSGNFTQRGIPAVFDKYFRAMLLVTKPLNTNSAHNFDSDLNINSEPAADIVVELPFPWCSAGAEAFALGGISAALGMGADSIVCGSEIGDSEYIKEAAEIRNSEEYIARIKEYEKNSLSSKRGTGSAVIADSVMRSFGYSLGANDKLAAEYARTLYNLNRSDVELNVFPRISENFISEHKACPENSYKSASDLRTLMYSGKISQLSGFVPENAYNAYLSNEKNIVSAKKLEELEYIFFKLAAVSDASVVESYADTSGGLTEHIRSCAASSGSAEEFMQKIRTKKYTDARLRRAMLYSILRVPPELLKTPPCYTVLLAANKKGREYLSEIRKNTNFPIITKPADADDTINHQYRFLKAADRLYTMCTGTNIPFDLFLKKHPYICP